MFWFFISQCKKVISNFVFLFLKIYDSARFNNMFQNSVLGSSLMSKELIEL
jgi:hypothetical protein